MLEDTFFPSTGSNSASMTIFSLWNCKSKGKLIEADALKMHVCFVSYYRVGGFYCK